MENKVSEPNRKKIRCQWASSNELFIPYHDEEWGVPEHDDRKLFEMLCLEGAQAGVTWLIVLKKREHYKKLFCNFEPEKIVKLSDEQLEEFLLDLGIIRNRLKVYSIRKNAEAFLKVKEEFGTFDRYIWQFTVGKTIISHYKTLQELPVSTPESDAMAKDLKKRGFKFVGSTICYAFMQAVGIFNDHTVDCWKYGLRT